MKARFLGCSRTVIALGAVSLASQANAQAFRQDAGAQSTAQQGSGAVQSSSSESSSNSQINASAGDIIVTAQRRAENIQNVPISIVAVTGENLVRSGAATADSIQRLAPGLSISTVGSGFVSYTYIRGGGTNQLDPGSDPSVAYYVDEVYLGGSAGLQFDLFDIDHVEVLKGPQGSLFGRNAASGAISIVTKRPSATFGGDAEFDYGNYSAVLARASLTGPLTSDGNLKFRLSGVYRRHDAYTTNLTGGRDPASLDSGGARGQIEFDHEPIKVLVTADFLRARNGMTNSFISTANVSGVLNAALPQPADQSFYAHYYDVNGYENQDLHDIDGRIEIATPIGTLTSLSAYRWNRFSRLQDQDGTLYDAQTFTTTERDKTFSQELRLTGDALSRLHYVLGLYYYNADTVGSYDLRFGLAASAALRGRTGHEDLDIKIKSYAAFGQIGFDITPRLNVTVGGRYTKDDKSDQRQVNYLSLLSYSVFPQVSFQKFTPAATISYKPTDTITAYFSYREGYKSGGFQSIIASSATLARTPFFPEEVKSYEAGVKATLIDRQLVADIAVFRSDITNQQVQRNVSATLVAVDNAGQTRTDGIDLLLQARPIPAFTFTANMTAQRARFRTYQSGAISYAGNAQLRSPDFTGYFSVDYRVPLGSVGSLGLLGEYSYRSKAFFDPANSRLPGLYQPSYGVGNARVTFAPARFPVEISGFIRNIGDIHYAQNISIPAPSGIYTPGQPRTYGVQLNAKF